MDQQKIDNFFKINQKFFPAEKIMYLKKELRSVSEERFLLICSLGLKNPKTVFFVSLFLGVFGIDRFMICDTGMGMLKLLTGGVCGILTLADWFTIAKRTKNLNFNIVLTFL